MNLLPLRFCTILLLFAGASFTGFAESNSARPNVLFISLDDVNSWVGAMGGHPQAKTPNIDRLAKRGVLFTRAYCAAPLCNPSRIAVVTGLRPSTSGVYGNEHRLRMLLPDAVTMPQYFKQNGYHVLGGGKVFDIRNGVSDPISWSEYFPIPPNNAKAPRDPEAAKKPFGWGPIKAEDDQMSDMIIANWAVEHLKREHEKPFFLAVGIYKPHVPLVVPQKYFDMHPLENIQLPAVKEDDLDDLPPTGREWATNAPTWPVDGHRKIAQHGLWKSAVQAYLASCSFADACVGKLIDALDQSAYAKNTIIVLWSDHGWHLGEKQHWQKQVLWERATLAPMIFVAPGVTKPNQRCERLVSLLDIYPTLTELCRLQTPRSIEGVSLVTLLKNPATKWDRPAVMTHGPNNHAVRIGQWRYIRYSNGDEELYDHSNDQHEWNNLAGNPKHASLKKELAGYFPKVNAPDNLPNSEFKKKPAERSSSE